VRNNLGGTRRIAELVPIENGVSRVIAGIRQMELPIVDRGQQRTIIAADRICGLDDHK
jgi:hypothetical protein